MTGRKDYTGKEGRIAADDDTNNDFKRTEGMYWLFWRQYERTEFTSVFYA